jgi:hypothetical protein
MMWEIDMQVLFYVAIFIGALLVAGGSFGSSMVTRWSGQREKAALQAQLDTVQTQLQKFEAALDKNTTAVLQAAKITPDDQWQSVELNSVPPGVADYALMLFRSDRGRITGKVRMKGSKTETAFSTSANDKLPLAVPNVWDVGGGHYQIPTVLEYAVTQSTDPAGRLSIFTAGWIDFLGQQPHL